MNLQQLKYFTVLAEVGHFGRAAEQLHITQPALSNSIKGLERELGSDLFERTGRKAVLTPYGMRFIPHIIKALGEIEQASSLSPTPRLDNPNIHIATVASVQQTFLPALLIDYAEEAHSELKRTPATFDILEASTTFICSDLLQGGKADLAFCGCLSASGYGWIPILPQYLVVAVNPSHPIANNKKVSIQDISDYPLISYRQPSYLYFSVKSLTDSLQLHFQEAFNNEVGAAPYIAANPQCVALLLDTVEVSLRSRIRYIPIEELEQPFHLLGLAYRYSSLNSESVANFVEYIEKRFASVSQITPIESLIGNH